MLLNLQAVRPEIRQRLKTACMAVAGLTALYLSIQPLRQAKEFRNQEMTGLGAVPEETLPETVVRKITLRNGVGGGVGGSVRGGDSFRAADAVQQAAVMSPLVDRAGRTKACPNQRSRTGSEGARWGSGRSTQARRAQWRLPGEFAGTRLRG